MKFSDEHIDEVILSIANTSWRKVAFVIAKVAETAGGESVDADAAYDFIATRIEHMVHSGTLLAQGDIKNWRYSEIRKPS